MLERPQDEPRLAVTPRYESQPFEADHRVASPVCEPVVAGDHRTNLVAGSGGTRRIDDASSGGEDELIRCQYEFGSHFIRRFGMCRYRGVKEPSPPLLLAEEGLLGQQGRHYL